MFNRLQQGSQLPIGDFDHSVERQWPIGDVATTIVVDQALGLQQRAKAALCQ